MEKISKAKAANDLSAAIKQAVDGQGGWGDFVRAGDKVLIKPNFNTADTYPGSTDLDFLREVVMQILGLGPQEVVVGDSSTMMARTEDVMQEIGVYALGDLDKRMKVVNFDKGKWTKKKIPQGKYLKQVSLTEYLGWADKLIFLPCLKTHFLAQYTGALKLAVGLMRPRERMGLHARHLQEKVADLNLAVKPDLSLMDARVCFISHGPMKGPTATPGLILASTQRAALDQEGVRIIQQFAGNSLEGVKPGDLPQIKRALELGIQ